MDPKAILYLIIIIATVSYVFDQFLDYLNLKALRTDIPDDIASFYDRTKYLKSLQYHRELTNFSFLTSAFSFILSILMLTLGALAGLTVFLEITWKMRYCLPYRFLEFS